eukprot:CFRG4500T1
MEEIKKKQEFKPDCNNEVITDNEKKASDVREENYKTGEEYTHDEGRSGKMEKPPSLETVEPQSQKDLAHPNSTSKTAHSTEVRMHKIVDGTFAVKTRGGSTSLMTGSVLKLMDTCACLSAENHAGYPAVTASMDDLVIANTVYEGELLVIKGKVNRAFNTSMEVGVIVSVYNFEREEERQVCTAYFTFISFREDGTKVKLPLLIPESNDEKRRYEMAFERRQIRISRKSKIASFREEVMSKNASESDNSLNCSLASLSMLELNCTRGENLGIKIPDNYRRESFMSPWFEDKAGQQHGHEFMEEVKKVLPPTNDELVLKTHRTSSCKANETSMGGPISERSLPLKIRTSSYGPGEISPAMSPITSPRSSKGLFDDRGMDESIYDNDERKKIHMAQTAIEHVEILLPQHTQHHGTAFGGQIMQWMVETGFISAHRVIKDTPMLRSIDDVHFINPSRLGERIHIFSQVNRTFEQSCEVGVRIEANAIGQPPRHINSAFLTFTSLKGTPTIPLAIRSELDFKRYVDAASRRKVGIDRAVLRSKETNLTVPWSENTRQDIIASNVRGLMLLVQSHNGWEKGVSTENDNMSVYMKQQAGRTCVKAECALPYSASRIFETLRVMPLRPMWDPIYKESIVVEILDEFNYIGLQRLKKTETTPEQELLVLVSVRQLGEVGDNYVVAFRSIDHDSYPTQESKIRAEIFSGGFVVKPVDNESCHLFYLQNGMTDSIMQYIASDFIGFSNTIQYTLGCMINFQKRLYEDRDWENVYQSALKTLQKLVKEVDDAKHVQNRTKDQEMELLYRRASMCTMVMVLARLREMEDYAYIQDNNARGLDSSNPHPRNSCQTNTRSLVNMSPRISSTLQLARRSMGEIEALFK